MFIAEPQTTGEAPSKKSDRLIYIGPNVPGGILHRWQVFKGGLPPYCEDIFQRVPEIKELFVAVEKLNLARERLEEPGSNEARLYSLVQRTILRGGKA